MDFKTIFEALPGNFFVLQPNPPHYTILAISDELLRITNKKRKEVVGNSLFEVYPENAEVMTPTGFSQLRASFQKIIENRKPEQIATICYNVPTASGTLEERYWSTNSKPLLDSDGEVLYIIHTTVDVTDQIKEGKKEVALRKKEKTYGLFMQAPVAICILTGPENIIELANEEMLKLWSRKPGIVGKPLFESIPEGVEQGFPEVLGEVRKTGTPYYATENPVELMIEGKPERRYYSFVYKPYYENPGDKDPSGVFCVANNVTEQVMARKKIEESAEELENLANAMPQVVWIAKSNGEVTYYNDRVSEFAGAKKMPNGTWSWIGLLKPEDEAPTVETWNKAVREGATYEKEHRLQMKDGSYRWHLSRALPQRDEKGTIVKWYGTATDVHEQIINEEALGRSEEQLRIAVEAAELGVFYFYPQIGKLVWSARTKELMGLPPDAEVNFETFLKVLHPDDRARSKGLVLEAIEGKNGGSYENEFRIINQADGKVRWMRSKGKANFDGEGKAIRFTGVTKDITVRKRSEEALELKNAQLLSINNDLDNFIYTASHDLKAPIINIEGLLQVLLQNLPAETLASERVQRITAMMQESVERFKKTIDNLTEVVKLQKENSQEAVSVNLAKVVREVQMDLEPMIMAAGAQLEVEVAHCHSIRFSEKNLRSVVYNLLSNGIKYRSPDRVPRVQIHCESAKEFDMLTVKDNGLGMEKKRLGQLFTMFKRFHAHVEGAGIGLYMVKKMVKNAGGYIEVESQVGEGSTFRVFFPR